MLFGVFLLLPPNSVGIKMDQNEVFRHFSKGRGIKWNIGDMEAQHLLEKEDKIAICHETSLLFMAHDLTKEDLFFRIQLCFSFLFYGFIYHAWFYIYPRVYKLVLIYNLKCQWHADRKREEGVNYYCLCIFFNVLL